MSAGGQGRPQLLQVFLIRILILILILILIHSFWKGACMSDSTHQLSSLRVAGEIATRVA